MGLTHAASKSQLFYMGGHAALSYPHEFLVVLFPSPKMLLFWERGKG